MIDISKGLDEFASRVIARRRLMKRTGAMAAFATAAGAVPLAGGARAATTTVSDFDVLNFALNLEYLEAEYYVRGVTGQPLSTFITNSRVQSGNVLVKTGSTQVQFTNPQLAYYFDRIASDEIAHVQFLLDALGSSAVTEPAIDLDTSWNTLAQVAGLGSSFDPFAEEIAFLVGAYVFEDVGVSAYAGGAQFLADPNNVSYAASVLAIEGYHAGAIRGFLATNGGSTVTNNISAVRAMLSGTGPNTSNTTPDDNGTSRSDGTLTIVNSDDQGQAFRRTFNQVLDVVYGGNATGGLFFPTGTAGTISSASNTYNNQNTV